MASYARVHFTPATHTAGGPDWRPRVLREIASENDTWPTGYEVNREEERIEPNSADQRLHPIDTTTIARRVQRRMNVHCDELEVQRNRP